MSDIPRHDSSPSLASVGVPVFQGENFLDETMTALRKQTYPNLEILVSDNASTDSTQEIVKRHQEADERVRLIVQESNIGAAENYNEVFRASAGEFFAWNAHDDLTTPDFIAAGVEALVANSDAVLAIARPYRVDASGRKTEEIPVPEELGSEHPHIRFRAAARSSPAGLVFGLFRSKTLAYTHLHGHFSGSDRNFVAETMLYGPMVWAGESEFHLREHRQRSVRSHSRKKQKFSHARDAWYDPNRSGHIVFPNWRRLGGYLAAVTTAPLGVKNRLLCYLAVGRLLFDDRLRLIKQMAYDVLTAGYTLSRRFRSEPESGPEAPTSGQR